MDFIMNSSCQPESHTHCQVARKPTAQTKTCQQVCLCQRAERHMGRIKYWLQQRVKFKRGCIVFLTKNINFNFINGLTVSQGENPARTYPQTVIHNTIKIQL